MNISETPKPDTGKPDDIVLTLVERAQLQGLLSHAADEGARRAMAQLGLAGSNGEDVQDLRSLLDQWRHVRRSSWLWFIKGAGWTLLAILLLDSAAKLAPLWGAR